MKQLFSSEMLTYSHICNMEYLVGSAILQTLMAQYMPSSPTEGANPDVGPVGPLRFSNSRKSWSDFWALKESMRPIPCIHGTKRYIYQHEWLIFMVHDGFHVGK